MFLFKKVFVKNKNPADSFGITPLHQAAMMGREEICKIILVVATDKNPKDEYGVTPLHKAAMNGNFKIFKMIFDVAKAYVLTKASKGYKKSKKGNPKTYFSMSKCLP